MYDGASDTLSFDEDDDVAAGVEKARKALLKMHALCSSMENFETAYLPYVPGGTSAALETCMKLTTAYEWEEAAERHNEIGSQFAFLSTLVQGSLEKMEKMQTKVEPQTKAVLDAVAASQVANTAVTANQSSYATAAANAVPTKHGIAVSPIYRPPPPKAPIMSNPLKRITHPDWWSSSSPACR